MMKRVQVFLALIYIWKITEDCRVYLKSHHLLPQNILLTHWKPQSQPQSHTQGNTKAPISHHWSNKSTVQISVWLRKLDYHWFNWVQNSDFRILMLLFFQWHLQLSKNYFFYSKGPTSPVHKHGVYVGESDSKIKGEQQKILSQENMRGSNKVHEIKKEDSCSGEISWLYFVMTHPWLLENMREYPF